ncbi:MAG: glycerol kinase GlpK [Saprospiraceae bacterium]|nr:glycerol kinase GlpK [Saprospiraceae bacterium]
MSQSFILAIDQGTTSSRSLLVDHAGSIVFNSQKEFTQYFPKPGWVEHDPFEIWSSQLSTIKEALEYADSIDARIEAIGITNQRETTIVWDKTTGLPVYNAIVWQDRRTTEYCESLKQEGWMDTIHQKTGLWVDAYFSASKIRWILKHLESQNIDIDLRNLVFGTVDSWLIYKLTNGAVHATDVSNASRTMIYNIVDLEWDKTLLDKFNIPDYMLPEVKSSKDNIGITHSAVLGKEIPICSAIGDQQSALFGQLCTQEGALKNTYGTGCFLVMNTGRTLKYSKHKLLSTIAWKVNGTVHYALEGSVFVGGAIVQWLRDGLELFNSSDEVEALAHSVKDNGGVYFVPALTGLGAPYWDSNARGAIIGITRGTRKAHIARAALEGIALQVFDIVKAMNEDLGAPIAELKVDGGASANNLLMQLQSDLIEANVVRPAVLESTALGAAFLAGLEVGFWDSIDDLKALLKVDKTFKPKMNELEKENLIRNWHKAIGRTKNWIDEN